MSFDNILQGVEKYYSGRILAHGATAKGVDWNSRESQRLRFDQLLRICDRSGAFTVNDYGCGYGALVDYLTEEKYSFNYRGFDLSEQMIKQAQELYARPDSVEFFSDRARLSKADYTVASGIFNVKLQTADKEWADYVLHTLDRISSLSQKGFAFNLLTKYSDKEFMRTDLYYADPLFLFDHCKRNYSKFISLIHDYPLFEFTILVRKS